MSDSRDSPAKDAAATVMSSDPDEMIGEIIDGRYRLVRYISQGGMGAVFEAEHVTIQKPIAVKILHAGLVAVPELVRRFEREAFAIGRIDHPNCIRVSDFGKLGDGSLFLVMEYLDGVSLGDEIDERGPMSTARALRVLRHVLRGLAHIHRADIVHRDIKPENIVLVTHDGDKDFAKLLDFGIAKLTGDAKRPEDHKLTQAGIAFGTPTYMSPEQTLGDSVDGRSDLYQATVVFFEMLAGRAPFRSDDKIELMAMHASRPPPKVTEFNAKARIPPEVQALLDRGLGKRASERFQTADEFLEAVDLAIAELGVTPPPRLDTPLPTQAPRNIRARTATPAPVSEAIPEPHRANLKVLVAIGLAFLLVGLVILTFTTGEKQKPAIAPPDASVPTSLAVQGAEALERGKPGEAIGLLTAAGSSIASDAKAQLVLGHAHAARNESKEMMEAYRQAITLDESLKFDSALTSNLKVLLDDKESFAVAARMMITELMDEEAKNTVIARATQKADGEWRHLALPLAEELGFIDSVDLRLTYELDLAEGTRCPYRQTAVAKLRALGNPAAIPALRAALKRRGKRGRTRGKLINACLKEDAEKAIHYLQTLEKTKASEVQP